jgi:hypothetical protein
MLDAVTYHAGLFSWEQSHVFFVAPRNKVIEMHGAGARQLRNQARALLHDAISGFGEAPAPLTEVHEATPAPATHGSGWAELCLSTCPGKAAASRWRSRALGNC